MFGDCLQAVVENRVGLKIYPYGTPFDPIDLNLNPKRGQHVDIENAGISCQKETIWWNTGHLAARHQINLLFVSLLPI